MLLVPKLVIMSEALEREVEGPRDSESPKPPAPFRHDPAFQVEQSSTMEGVGLHKLLKNAVRRFSE
jgi:hypothetical protein